MIQIDNIQYRNLEEQVLRNTEILNLLPNGLTGTNFRGIFATTQDAGQINNNEMALVGSSAPYTLYYKSDEILVDLGQFPTQGPQGIQGIAGPEGPRGTNGTEIKTGSTKPTVAAAENTIYLNYANGDIYVYNNGWALKGNIRGPQGVIGNTGPQGIQGPIGPQGPQGIQGEPGASYRIEGQVFEVSELPSAATHNAYLVGDNLFISINGVWKDTGMVFPSNIIDVAQTTGNSTTLVMSQKATTDTIDALQADLNEKTLLLNPNNLLKNATFKNGFTNWRTPPNNLATIEEIDFPANKIKLKNLGEGTYFRQFFTQTGDLEAGTYCLGLTWDEEAYESVSDIFVGFYGYTSASASATLIKRVNYNTPANECSFELTPTDWYQFEFRIHAGYHEDEYVISRPVFAKGTDNRFYIDKYEGIFDELDKIPDIETEITNIKNDIASQSYVNSNNLVKNPTFNTTADWQRFDGTIIETGLPANKVSITNSGDAVYLYQYQPIANFTSGTYYLSLKWLSGTAGYIRVYGIDSSYASTLIKTVNSSTIESDKFFELDTSLYSQIEIRVSLGYITTIEITEPMLFKVDDTTTSPTFYNAPYQATFDAVGDIEALKNTGTLSPLFGKILSANGDSIAEGITSNGGYVRQIAEANNMTYQNVAVSGGTIVPTSGKYSIVGGIASMRSDADYILLEGGVNDTYTYARGDITLGNIGTDFKSFYDTSTYCNAFQKMIIDAYAKWPTKTILYVSPHNHGNWTEGNDIYDASIAMCKKWGIPVCNLTQTTAPLGRIIALRIYTNNEDGQHPTSQGYSLFYTPQITSQLVQISK